MLESRGRKKQLVSEVHKKGGENIVITSEILKSMTHVMAEKRRNDYHSSIADDM